MFRTRAQRAAGRTGATRPKGFTGPSPNLPTVSRPSADSLTGGTPADREAILNQALGLVSRNTAVQTLFGVGTGTGAAQSQREQRTDLRGSTGKANPPAFDQGCASTPASRASNPVASRPATGTTTPTGRSSERSEGDRIEISRSGFGLVADSMLSFQAVRTEAELSSALSSVSLVIKDLRDGSLLFNQNGSAAGMGQGGVFGQVGQGLSLQPSDFGLIA